MNDHVQQPLIHVQLIHCDHVWRHGSTHSLFCKVYESMPEWVAKQVPPTVNEFANWQLSCPLSPWAFVLGFFTMRKPTSLELIHYIHVDFTEGDLFHSSYSTHCRGIQFLQFHGPDLVGSFFRTGWKVSRDFCYR